MSDVVYNVYSQLTINTVITVNKMYYATECAFCIILTLDNYAIFYIFGAIVLYICTLCC